MSLLLFTFMLSLHFCYTQDGICATDGRALDGAIVSSPQPIVQVAGSGIATLCGMVVQGFHFLMVALQNGTILQVCARSVCVYILVNWIFGIL